MSARGRIEAPLLRVAAAERETGGVALEVLGAGEIRRQDARGLEPADPQDLGGAVAGRGSRPRWSRSRFRPVDAQAPRGLTVELVRYTPEAILVANVDEAHYRALLTEGRQGAGAGAVRGAQQPARSWRSRCRLAPRCGARASPAGRLRPGSRPDGTLLLPLRKGKAGEEAPAFAVEVAFLTRAGAWTERGLERFALPALDLPVSRTGLALHHSPRFQVALVSGAFRAGTGRDAPVRRPERGGRARASRRQGSRRQGRPDASGRAAEQKQLIDRFQEGRSRRVASVTPLEVPFPEVGPALFLVGELTAEGTAPAVELSYKRESSDDDATMVLGLLSPRVVRRPRRGGRRACSCRRARHGHAAARRVRPAGGSGRAPADTAGAAAGGGGAGERHARAARGGRRRARDHGARGRGVPSGLRAPVRRLGPARREGGRAVRCLCASRAARPARSSRTPGRSRSRCNGRTWSRRSRAARRSRYRCPGRLPPARPSTCRARTSTRESFLAR